MADQEPQTVPSLSTLLERLRTRRLLPEEELRDVLLVAGRFIGENHHYWFYRFEVPEDIGMYAVGAAEFSYGKKTPATVEGTIVQIENQFMVVAFPCDFGEIIPEMSFRWGHKEQHRFLSELERRNTGNAIVGHMLKPSAQPEPVKLASDPVIPTKTPPDEAEAVRKVLGNTVTLMWGATLCGKSCAAVIAALNCLKQGKSVLYVGATPRELDQSLMYALDVAKEFELDLASMTTRLGLLLPGTGESPLTPLSYDAQRDQLTAHRRKLFQERITMLRRYRELTVKKFLHEDYFLRIEETREKINDRRKKLEEIESELHVQGARVTELKNASLMDKLKKGFSTQDLEAAETKLAETKEFQKRLQAIQEAQKREVVLVEAHSPIPFEEQKEYKGLVERIEELGGIGRVEASIEEFLAFKPIDFLRARKFIATTPAALLSDPVCAELKFSTVIVDDAEAHPIPVLAALASMAQDRVIITGDPFQGGGEGAPDAADAILQRDLFTWLAETEDLPRLFGWAERNPQWCVFLSSQYATTPKLSLFVSAVIFDDRLNVFVPPKAPGKVYFLDTSEMPSRCLQYLGKKKILPFNELQTKRTVEFVKHALMEPGRRAQDVGVILPFSGATHYTRQQLRLAGIERVEVGVPATFRGCRKKAIVFDTTMAGVDYTMRQIDDKKVGETRIILLLGTVFASVEEDLYIVANMHHFSKLYKDRLFTRLLMLLQAQADPLPKVDDAMKKFAQLDTVELHALNTGAAKPGNGTPREDRGTRDASAIDPELAIQLKLMERQKELRPAAQETSPEQETVEAVRRILALREDINILMVSLGSRPLFRVSLATQKAGMHLLRDVCRSEKDFRDNLERWNLLIYETAIGSKTESPYFNSQSPETRVRADIRTINTAYSQEVSAALEEGKQKIAVAVSKIFQETVGKSQPATPAEWHRVYMGILNRLESYFLWISEQARK